MPFLASDQSNKFLTFILHGKYYGVAARKVREIINVPKIAPVPHLPAYIRGVTNHRGRVVPIVDMRVKFGLDDSFDEKTCIVIVRVTAKDGREVSVGLLVDALDGVLSLAPSEVEPPPSFVLSVGAGSVRGMAKVGGRMYTLLDIERVVNLEVVESVLRIS